MPAVQSLLTQGSATSEVGRIQGLFATSQTACTAVAAAAAGAAFAVASWLPFVAVALTGALGLAVATVVWWTVPGRVGRPGLPNGTGSVRAATAVGPMPEAGPAPALSQPAVPDTVGVSVDVQ